MTTAALEKFTEAQRKYTHDFITVPHLNSVNEKPQVSQFKVVPFEVEKSSSSDEETTKQ
jgi:hypothetical protein